MVKKILLFILFLNGCGTNELPKNTNYVCKIGNNGYSFCIDKNGVTSTAEVSRLVGWSCAGDSFR